MELEPFEFRDPGAAVAHATADRPLRAGDIVLAVVREPSDAQEVIRVTRLPRRRGRLERWDRSQLLAWTAERICPTRVPGRAPQYAILTIVARNGPAVIGPAEGEWLIAWQYSNHSADAYSGDLVVVTEHGWTDMMSGLGGHEPRLRTPTPAADACL